MRILVVEDETKMPTNLRQTFQEERHAQKLIHTVPGLGVSSGSRPTRNWTLRSRLTVWSAVFCAVAVALRKHQVDSLDGRILASESGITFDLDLRLQAEEFVDARYFTQILLNLLRNAVKCNHPGGSVRVALNAQESAWVIGIARTGPGQPVMHFRPATALCVHQVSVVLLLFATTEARWTRRGGAWQNA